jgi:hypothetical protein
LSDVSTALDFDEHCGAEAHRGWCRYCSAWRPRRSIRTRRRSARALRTIRTLAIVAPEFVLPQVYERALVALSSDTDAHQAPVSFHVVSQTLFDACASMGVPFLRRFLPPLADLALAALDANDSKKASAALRFFSVTRRRRATSSTSCTRTSSAPSRWRCSSLTARCRSCATAAR